MSALNQSSPNKSDVREHTFQLFCSGMEDDPGGREECVRRFIRTFTSPGTCVRKNLMQYANEQSQKGGMTRRDESDEPIQESE